MQFLSRSARQRHTLRYLACREKPCAGDTEGSVRALSPGWANPMWQVEAAKREGTRSGGARIGPRPPQDSTKRPGSTATTSPPPDLSALLGLHEAALIISPNIVRRLSFSGTWHRMSNQTPPAIPSRAPLNRAE